MVIRRHRRLAFPSPIEGGLCDEPVFKTMKTRRKNRNVALVSRGGVLLKIIREQWRQEDTGRRICDAR